MKTAEIVYSTKKKKGDKQYGKLFNNGKVRKRREWRGIKDTLYDFSRWLYLWSIMIGVTLSRGGMIIISCMKLKETEFKPAPFKMKPQNIIVKGGLLPFLITVCLGTAARCKSFS